MTLTRLAFAFALSTALGLPAANAAPRLGEPAPAFSVVDTAGKTRTLDEFRGRTLVLEWTNDGCPYVKKHYNSGNMQKLQQDLTSAGVTWLSVISSAPGKQGNVTPAQANELTASRKAHPTAVLLDPSGTMGRAYEAQTTPHMFVIDPAGKLRYMGAIDDKPSTDPATVGSARNYVREAVAAVTAGKPVATPASDPYGCSVKY